MISPLLVPLVDELALLAVALVLVVDVQVVAAAAAAAQLLPLLFLLVRLVLQLFPCCLRGCERKRLRKPGEGGRAGSESSFCEFEPSRVPKVRVELSQVYKYCFESSRVESSRVKP